MSKKNPFVFLDVSIDGDPIQRMVFELFYDLAPKTAENFRALCTGEKGLSSMTGKPLHYKGTFFHRIIRGSMAQAGDLLRRDGELGESIYGEKFPDEKPTLPHDEPGLLSMAIADLESRGSLFSITLKANHHLNKKNIVFGKLVEGHDVLKKIENCGDEEGRSDATVKIIKCGENQDDSESDSDLSSSLSDISSSSDGKRKKRKRSKRRRSKHGKKRDRKRDKRRNKRSKHKSSKSESNSRDTSDSDTTSDTETDISSSSDDKRKKRKRSKRRRSKHGTKRDRKRDKRRNKRSKHKSSKSESNNRETISKDGRKRAFGGSGGSESGTDDDTGTVHKHDEKHNNSAEFTGMTGVGREITVRVKERYKCQSFESYKSMNLTDELLNCIPDKGTNQPSLPEMRGIVPLLLGQNFIHMAYSSPERRRTMCYGVLGRLDYENPNCQVVILAPDQPSAKNVKELLLDLGESLNVKVGGCSSSDENQTNFHVFVDTLANVDLVLTQKLCNCHSIISFILESADMLIRFGFESQICDIFQLLPHRTQVGMFFSNEYDQMSLEFLRFTRKIMVKDPTYLISSEDGSTFKGIKIVDSQLTCGNAKHFYMDVDWDINKENYLKALLERRTHKSIVYVTRESFDYLRNSQSFDENLPVSFIPTTINREDQKKIIGDFKKKLIEGDSLMLITVVGVRSILEDMDGVVVINYDLPTSPYNYMGRIGYCEKHKYEVINFITIKNDMDFFKIQDYYNFVIGCIPPERKMVLFGNDFIM